MRLETARWGLFIVFIISLIGLAATLIIAFSSGEISSGSLTNMLTKLVAIYSVHLAVIVGGIFGRGTASPESMTPRLAFWAALVLAVVWNAGFLWRFIFFVVSADDTVERLSTYVETLAPVSSFLVAGALSFFFAKRD